MAQSGQLRRAGCPQQDDSLLVLLQFSGRFHSIRLLTFRTPVDLQRMWLIVEQMKIASSALTLLLSRRIEVPADAPEAREGAVA